MPLGIDFQDVLRATLAVGSGNEGWIGVSPSGEDYHVVVPVDVQIARGVMAGNLPMDGTPFGGYSGWLYFRCPPHEDGPSDEETLKLGQASATASGLLQWLRSYQIEAVLLNTDGGEEARSIPVRTSDPQPSRGVECLKCGEQWQLLGRFLQDRQQRLDRYEACTESFRDGLYVFSHNCGGEIRLPVSRFIRSVRGLRSLIGTHACPGSCYYPKSWRVCEATCDGAMYRRIAIVLRDRSQCP
jgi:hypothetical protein